MTPDEIQARSARTVHAAAEAARGLGLQVEEPRVLHDVFSVVVHLAPSPVVARVPVVVPEVMRGDRLRARQQRELDAVAWLAANGVPVVAPSPLVPRAPVQHEGLWMTFWELAEVAPEHVPYGSVDAGLVVELHAVLRDYPVEDLPFLSPVNPAVPALLRSLESTPELIEAADLERARAEWEVLEPVLTSVDGLRARFPGAELQAVHGDAPSYNVILTTSGPRFADFEDVNLAPREWDLALAPVEDVESYNREAGARGLPQLNGDLLQVMSAARMLQMISVLALVPELPVLAGGLRSLIESWRTMPFAGGIA